jgi:hypothetical protein
MTTLSAQIAKCLAAQIASGERLVYMLQNVFGPGFESQLDDFGISVWRGAIARNWLS